MNPSAPLSTYLAAPVRLAAPTAAPISQQNQQNQQQTATAAAAAPVPAAASANPSSGGGLFSGPSSAAPFSSGGGIDADVFSAPTSLFSSAAGVGSSHLTSLLGGD